MTTLEPKPIETRPWPVHQPVKGSAFARLLRTTDAKQIGLMYLVTSFIFFLVGGLMALLMRAELARPGPAVPVAGAVQPAVHHARHDHAAVLRHADRVRLRELHRAAADRRSGRFVPAAERPGLLALRVRRHARRRRLHHPGRCRRLRLVRLPAAGQPDQLAGRRRRHVDHGPGDLRSGYDPRRRQHDHHDPDAARARHDDVPHVDLHLEHPGDVAAGSDGLPDPGRGAAGVRGRPATRRSRLRRQHRRRDAVATPVLVLRPSRGLYRRVAVLRHHLRESSRSSAASRSSATRAWWPRRWASPRCR